MCYPLKIKTIIIIIIIIIIDIFLLISPIQVNKMIFSYSKNEKCQ